MQTYKKLCFFVLGLLLLLSVNSCSQTKNFYISCDNPDVEIYVDGNHIGSVMTEVSFPGKHRSFEIVGVMGGKEVYHRTINTSGYKSGSLIEITPSDPMYYSTEE